MADIQTVETVVKITDGDSRKTIAGIRKEIKGYRDDLVNLDKDSQEYIDTVDKIAVSEKVLADINQEVKDSIRSLNESVSDNIQLEESQQNTIKSLNAEIKAYKDELLNLEYGTTSYYNKLKELSSAQSSLNNINDDIKASTMSVADSISGAFNSAAGLVGGYTALQGVVTLLGVENNVLTQTFVKLQASMAIVQGLKAMTDGIKAARIAFKALNTTMYANPIMAVVAAITILVGWVVSMRDEFSFFTDELGAVWDAVKSVLPSFEKMGEVLQGVGTALTRYLLAPIKSFIRLVQGDFQGAIDEFSKGMSVVANFEEGASKQAEKNAKARTEKILEGIRETNLAAANELKAQIDRNNAKYGSDWKYTRDAQRLYESYYTRLSLAYKQNSTEYENALNQLYSYQRSVSDKIDADEKKRQDERNKAAESANAKAVADEKKRLEDEEKAQKSYSDIMSRIAKETQKALTDTYIGETRINWLKGQLNANRELANSLKETAENDKLSWKARETAANEYRNTLIQLNADQKEYDKLIEDRRISDVAERQAKLEFEQQMQEYNREETGEEEKERLKQVIDSNLAIANNTSFTLDARKKAWDKYIKAREQYDKVEEELAKADEERRKATLETTANFLDASAKLVGENTVAGKAMAIASATVSTYLSAQQAFASMSGIPIVGPALGAIAAATAIAAGLANIKAITSTKVPGVSDNSSSSAISAPSLPDMPEMDANFIETHNNLDSYDRESLNSVQPVLVAEDVNQKQRKLKIVENNVTF